MRMMTLMVPIITVHILRVIMFMILIDDIYGTDCDSGLCVCAAVYQMCTTKWRQAADMHNCTFAQLHKPRLRSISKSYIGARMGRIGA